MAIVVTLALEAVLLLALLLLGQSAVDDPVPVTNITSFDAAERAVETPDEATPKAKVPEKSALPRFAAAPTPRDPQPEIVKTPPEIPDPKPTAPALIPLSRDQMRSSDISGRQAGGAPKAAYGPADTGVPGDSERVGGSGPNGEPLYAARWYTEPTRGEMEGYLSTARGPGWALINCRTAPDWRVENCVLVSEHPQGSQMGRAVLAAAWQFKVRPPRVGGVSKVGEWVRIRIIYDSRP